MDFIALLVGLVLLIKGDFQFGQRRVPKQRGRLAGLVLMAPVFISVCTGTIAISNALNQIDMEEFIELDTDTQMETLQNVFIDYLNSFSSIAFLVLVVAIVAALYLILSSPIGAPPVPQAASFSPYPTPVGPVSQVLTPAEAAAYLRVSESDVRALIDEGRLAAAKIGGDYRIARRAVDDFLSDSRARKDDDPFADL